MNYHYQKIIGYVFWIICLVILILGCKYLISKILIKSKLDNPTNTSIQRGLTGSNNETYELVLSSTYTEDDSSVYPINSDTSPVTSWENKGLKRIFNLAPNTRYGLTFNDLTLVFESDDDGSIYINKIKDVLPINCLEYNIITLTVAQGCEDVFDYETGTTDNEWCVWPNGAPQIEVEESTWNCDENIMIKVLLNTITSEANVRPITTKNIEKTARISNGALEITSSYSPGVWGGDE
jgi:hypothetical protein